MWSFYAEQTDRPFPARWHGTADFGPSESGRFPGDPPTYQGRRVDLLSRSLPVPLEADPADVLRGYLSAARTASAKALAAKAVVLIDPANRAGEIIWPATRGEHRTVGHRRNASLSVINLLMHARTRWL